MERTDTLKRADLILSASTLTLVLVTAAIVVTTGELDEFTAWAWDRHHNVLPYHYVHEVVEKEDSHGNNSDTRRLPCGGRPTLAHSPRTFPIYSQARRGLGRRNLERSDR